MANGKKSKNSNKVPNRKTKRNPLGPMAEGTLNELEEGAKDLDLMKTSDELRKKLGKVEKQNENLKLDISNLTETIQDDKAEIINLKNIIKEKEEEIDKMANKVKATEIEMENQAKQAEIEMENQAKESDIQLQSLLEKLKILEEKEKELCQKLETSENKVKELEESNKEKDKGIEKLTKEKEKLNKDREQDIANAKEEAKMELERELREMEEEEFLMEFVTNEKKFFMNLAKLLDMPLDSFDIRKHLSSNDSANAQLVQSKINQTLERITEICTESNIPEIGFICTLASKLKLDSLVSVNVFSLFKKIRSRKFSSLRELIRMVKSVILNEQIFGEQTEDKFKETLNDIYKTGGEVEIKEKAAPYSMGSTDEPQEEETKQEDSKEQEEETKQEENENTQGEENMNKNFNTDEVIDVEDYEVIDNNSENKGDDKFLTRPLINETHFRIACEKYALDVLYSFGLSKKFYFSMIDYFEQDIDDLDIQINFHYIQNYISKKAKKEKIKDYEMLEKIITEKLDLTTKEVDAVINVFEKVDDLDKITLDNVEEIIQNELIDLFNIDRTNERDIENEIKYNLADIFSRNRDDIHINQQTGQFDNLNEEIIKDLEEKSKKESELGSVKRAINKTSSSYHNTSLGIKTMGWSADIVGGFRSLKNSILYR